MDYLKVGVFFSVSTWDISNHLLEYTHLRGLSLPMWNEPVARVADIGLKYWVRPFYSWNEEV